MNASRRGSFGRRPAGRGATLGPIETLESRALLSASGLADFAAAPNLTVEPLATRTPAYVYTPSQVRHAYGDDTPMLIAISGKWTGQTDELLGRIVGFKHYCLKPCEPQKLLELLKPLTGGET